jgi:hypothetical protein
MMRRTSFLLSCYGEGNPDLDYPGLAKRAEAVRTAENHLAWTDWRRYSRRQKKDMRLGGMTGSAVYEGNLGEFMPFAEFCETVHAGKNTGFGLGKMNLEMLS